MENANPFAPFFDMNEHLPPGDEASEASSAASEATPSERGNPDDGVAPRYLPPHKRPVQLEMGEHIVMYTGNDDPDKIQGASGDKVKRLLFYVNFALVAASIKALHARFPMVHFHSRGFFNHDHPISHVITMLGTRQLQRMLPAGARILDVYGNQNACDSFNAGQVRGQTPKWMRALVTNWGGSDFLREITKWGPPQTADGEPRYLRNTIRRQYEADRFEGFNCFQMIHTLYYVSKEDILRMVHATKGNMIMGLVHTHPGESGFINEGEQRFAKANGFVRQWNVKTNTRYTHYDLAPFYFRENKTHWGSDEFEGLGFQWECHFVCENTWIIQIVGAVKDDIEDEDCVDFDAGFEGELNSESARQLMKDDYLPTEPLVEFIMTPEGKALPLQLTSIKLLDELKGYARGKPRTPKLFDELVKHAGHLTRKSHLFPDQEVLDVDTDHVIDHVVAAFCNNAREAELVGAMASMKDVMSKYNMNLRGGGKFANPTFNTLFEACRGIVGAAATVNRVYKSQDKIGRGIAALEDALAD